MSEPQSFKSHGRFDPPYHFFLTIVSIASIVIAVIYCVHHFCFYRCGWWCFRWRGS